MAARASPKGDARVVYTGKSAFAEDIGVLQGLDQTVELVDHVGQCCVAGERRHGAGGLYSAGGAGGTGRAGGTRRGDVKRKVVNNHLFNNKSLSHYNKKPSRAT